MGHADSQRPMEPAATDERTRASAASADLLTNLSAELDPLLVRMRELHLGESAVAAVFDANRGAKE
jgi:hypothetical protein